MKAVVLLIFSSLPIFAQTRLIPHLTAPGGTFSSSLIFTNTTGEAAAYTLNGYALGGQELVLAEGTLEPGQTVYRTVQETFGRDDVSHFTIDGPESLRVAVAYQALTDGSGPAHVNETDAVSKVWRLQAGNGVVTWDGLAMVNRGTAPTTVTARHINAEGQTLGSAVLAEGLAVNGKALAILSLTFSSVPNSYFEIFSEQVLSITALRGNQASDFFWENSGVSVAEQAPDTLDWELARAYGSLFFNGLIGMVPAPDGARMYAVLRHGVIEVFANDDSVNSKAVFLDISDQISTGGELGLLDMVFHPNYADNGYVFVNYATSVGGLRSVVSRFTATDADSLDPSSELVVFEVAQPFDNHNGGQLAFGDDGYLYVGLGDGGSAGDPQNNAQNPATPLGSMLRIDVDQSRAGLNYAVPGDNPFVGNALGWLEETYAYGLRNPWRFGFDDWAGKSRLFAADVGQGEVEEIDIIEAGGNYGWRIMEGNLCYNPSSNCDPTGLSEPLYHYNHDAGDQSITGGFVYRGVNEPALFGHYIYGDFVSGRIWALEVDGTSPKNTLLVDSGRNPVSFADDGKGNILMCHIGGSVFRLVRAAQ